ncbi:hypothetical protein [Luteibacter jiangsuensis]
MKVLTPIVAAMTLLVVTPSSQAQYSSNNLRRGHGDWGRCIGYLPQAISQGQLNAGERRIVHTWTTTCHSAFSASAVGVTIYVQKLTEAGWSNLTIGISSNIADVGPGTYRIVAVNDWPSRTNFRVRHRQGLG